MSVDESNAKEVERILLNQTRETVLLQLLSSFFYWFPVDLTRWEIKQINWFKKNKITIFVYSHLLYDFFAPLLWFLVVILWGSK